MKIAFLVPSFPALSETFILNQIIGLLDRGYEVDIFAKFNPGEKKTHPDIEKYNIMKRVYYIKVPGRTKRLKDVLYFILTNFYKNPMPILKSVNILKYGRKALNLSLLYTVIPFLKKEYDIIHCHFGPIGLFGAFLKEIGIKSRLVTTFHGFDVNSFPSQEGSEVYNDLFSRGDIFTANTYFTKQRLMWLGCDQSKIEILPVGLRISKFKFFPRGISKEGSIKILTVGRLVEKKGHKYAINAIANIISKYKNIKYIIAGDGPLRRDLEFQVESLGVSNYVEFLGAVDEDEVLKLYQQAHIFILPSVTASDGDMEGQALVLQEAQASGLPVISTFHNGIPEGVLDGKSGFLVPEKDVDALADRLEYLIEHPEIWPKMGREGRKFVEDKYDIQKLNGRLVEIYKRLIYREV